MKKLFIVFCLACLFATIASAQSLEKLFETFKNNTEVIHQTVSPEMMKMMLPGAPDSASQKKNPAFLKQIHGMDIYVLEKYQDKKAEEIIKTMDAYKGEDGYEILLAVNEDKDHVKFVAKKESENKYSEIDMLVRDENDLVLIRFTGLFSMDDLQQLMKEQGDKFEKK